MPILVKVQRLCVNLAMLIYVRSRRLFPTLDDSPKRKTSPDYEPNPSRHRNLSTTSIRLAYKKGWPNYPKLSTARKRQTPNRANASADVGLAVSSSAVLKKWLL